MGLYRKAKPGEESRAVTIEQIIYATLHPDPNDPWAAFKRAEAKAKKERDAALSDKDREAISKAEAKKAADHEKSRTPRTTWTFTEEKK